MSKWPKSAFTTVVSVSDDMGLNLVSYL